MNMAMIHPLSLSNLPGTRLQKPEANVTMTQA